MKEKEMERLSSMVEFEEEFYKKGYSIIAGVDEAGRGPLAGDVYAAAVILERGTIIEGLNDSKKISPKKRDMLFDTIKEKALSYSLGVATVEEIEKLDILNATFLAMRRAIEGLSVKPEFIMVDGNQRIRELELMHEPVIKGDSLSMSIAAASILAKVERDRYMEEMAEKYPEYEFSAHKGYGTARHSELIRKFGPCPIHRLSFLKNILK